MPDDLLLDLEKRVLNGSYRKYFKIKRNNFLPHRKSPSKNLGIVHGTRWSLDARVRSPISPA
jgi:hypothetical protein